MRHWWLPLALIAGCALSAMSPALVAADAKSSDCPQPPAGSRAAFRHVRSRMIALGSPHHRGVDLIAVEGDENQTLGGKLAYTRADTDLEDEDVEIFACVGKAWQPLGTTRTNDDGRFTLVLGGAARLPTGMTDLYAYVPGDGSGTRFLGFVAARGQGVIVTDIDGTLTSSENGIVKTYVAGTDLGHQPGAPEVLAASGKPVIYVTARGDQLTDVTRHWLASHGFPRGPVRLGSSFLTLPGGGAQRLKTRVIGALRVPIAAAIGNRPSDAAAYRSVGVAPERIFIKDVATTRATVFTHYRELASALAR